MKASDRVNSLLPSCKRTGLIACSVLHYSKRSLPIIRCKFIEIGAACPIGFGAASANFTGKHQALMIGNDLYIIKKNL